MRRLFFTIGGRAAGALGPALALLWVGCIDANTEPEGAAGEVSYVPGTPVPSGGAFSAGSTTGTTAAPTANTGAQNPVEQPASTGGGTGEPAIGGTSSPQPRQDAGTGVGVTDSSVAGPEGGSEPIAEAGTSTPAEAGPMPSSGPAEGELHVEFTSVSLGGRYSPKNIGAVWVEDSSGSYIKTLERWAGIRARYLSDWNAASGGWGFFGSPEPDAVSQATLTRHESHSLTWDSRDLDGQVVPDGSYTLRIELTDADRAGASAAIPFEKSSQGFSETPADQQPYTGLSVRYEP